MNSSVFISSDYSLIWIVVALCISAIVSYSSYPIIIKISRLKELMQEPGTRSSHLIKTPNLGGIGIFLGVVTVLTFIGSILSYNNLLCLIGALVVLFFTGLKDDLVELTPIHKLIGQIAASLCVIIITDIRIYSFFGMFGIELLPYFISVVFTLFVFVLIINAINLIDGVDGLAGSIGIMCSALFGLFFFNNGNDSMLFISLSLIGALATFLVFNFSKTEKIFMGDTGSMIIGFLLAYQGVSFLRVDYTLETFNAITNPPILLIAVFSFPLMDTLRVFIIRILQKRSPFSADKNHIHHNLLDLGFKHWQISLIASLFILLMVTISYNFKSFDLHISLLSIIAISSLFSVTPFLILKLNSNPEEVSGKPSFEFKSLTRKPHYFIGLKKTLQTIVNVFISMAIYFNIHQ